MRIRWSELRILKITCKSKETQTIRSYFGSKFNSILFYTGQWTTQILHWLGGIFGWGRKWHAIFRQSERNRRKPDRKIVCGQNFGTCPGAAGRGWAGRLAATRPRILGRMCRFPRSGLSKMPPDWSFPGRFACARVIFPQPPRQTPGSVALKMACRLAEHTTTLAEAELAGGYH